MVTASVCVGNENAETLTQTERHVGCHQVVKGGLNSAKCISRPRCCLARPRCRLATSFCCLASRKKCGEKLHHINGARPVAGPILLQGGGWLRSYKFQHE